jgi:hypothetical protein
MRNLAIPNHPADVLRRRKFRTAILGPTYVLTTIPRNASQRTKTLQRMGRDSHRTGITDPPIGPRPQTIEVVQRRAESENGLLLLPAIDRLPPPSS